MIVGIVAYQITNRRTSGTEWLPCRARLELMLGQNDVPAYVLFERMHDMAVGGCESKPRAPNRVG